MRLAEKVQEKTAFLCRYGTHQFQVMIFDLINARTLFQRIKSNVFKNMACVKDYIDHVVVGSESMREQANHLIELCEGIRESRLRVTLASVSSSKTKQSYSGIALAQVGWELI